MVVRIKYLEEKIKLMKICMVGFVKYIIAYYFGETISNYYEKGNAIGRY